MKLNAQIKIEPMAPQMMQNIESELRLIAFQALGACSNFSPINTGQLQKSFTSSAAVINTEKMSENLITVTFGTPLWGRPKGYGMYQEFGTRPHWMPLQPLIDWVWSKGLANQSSDIEYSGGKTKRVRGQSNRSYIDSKVIRIARAIQRKIAARGTPARLFVSEALATMGLQHKQTTDSVDWIYDVDPTPWLMKAGVFERIMK